MSTPLLVERMALAVEEIPASERPKGSTLRFRIVALDETGQPYMKVPATLRAQRAACEALMAQIAGCDTCYRGYVLGAAVSPHAAGFGCVKGRQPHCQCEGCAGVDV